MIRINLLEAPKPKNKRSAMPSMPTMEVGDVGSPRLKVLIAFGLAAAFNLYTWYHLDTEKKNIALAARDAPFRRRPRAPSRHGAGAGRLRVWKLVRELCCQVDDGDPPREDLAWHPGGSTTNTADASDQSVVTSMSCAPGHGLWLVRRVADRMSTLSGPDGTRVRVAFNLP